MIWVEQQPTADTQRGVFSEYCSRSQRMKDMIEKNPLFKCKKIDDTNIILYEKMMRRTNSWKKDARDVLSPRSSFRRKKSYIFPKQFKKKMIIITIIIIILAYFLANFRGNFLFFYFIFLNFLVFIEFSETEKKVQRPIEKNWRGKITIT